MVGESLRLGILQPWVQILPPLAAGDSDKGLHPHKPLFSPQKRGGSIIITLSQGAIMWFREILWDVLSKHTETLADGAQRVWILATP